MPSWSIEENLQHSVRSIVGAPIRFGFYWANLNQVCVEPDEVAIKRIVVGPARLKFGTPLLPADSCLDVSVLTCRVLGGEPAGPGEWVPPPAAGATGGAILRMTIAGLTSGFGWGSHDYAIPMRQSLEMVDKHRK